MESGLEKVQSLYFREKVEVCFNLTSVFFGGGRGHQPNLLGLEPNNQKEKCTLLQTHHSAGTKNDLFHVFWFRRYKGGTLKSTAADEKFVRAKQYTEPSFYIP